MYLLSLLRSFGSLETFYNMQRIRNTVCVASVPRSPPPEISDGDLISRTELVERRLAPSPVALSAVDCRCS
jgi:hypothetical protein